MLLFNLAATHQSYFPAQVFFVPSVNSLPLLLKGQLTALQTLQDLAEI